MAPLKALLQSPDECVFVGLVPFASAVLTALLQIRAAQCFWCSLYQEEAMTALLTALCIAVSGKNALPAFVYFMAY
jgi:hypothetical protein